VSASPVVVMPAAPLTAWRRVSLGEAKSFVIVSKLFSVNAVFLRRRGVLVLSSSVWSGQEVNAIRTPTASTPYRCLIRWPDGAGERRESEANGELGLLRGNAHNSPLDFHVGTIVLTSGDRPFAQMSGTTLSSPGAPT